MAIKLHLHIYIILLISCGTLTGNPEGDGGDDSQGEANTPEITVPDSEQTAENEDEQDNSSENIASGDDSEAGGEKFQEVKTMSESEMLAQNDTNSGVKIFLTDAPVDDFSHIMIHLDKVILVGEQGQIEQDIEDTLINMLDLQGGVSALVADFDSAPLGTYSEIRLVLTSDRPSYGILKSGGEINFEIPSASSSGIKIKYDFEVSEGRGANIVLDFDLRKSVKQRGNGIHFMVPVLRPVLQADSGAVELTLNNRASLVCVFSELSDAENDSECDQAISSATEKNGKYKLSFLPRGTYVVKILYKDLPQAFIQNVEVVAGNTTDLNDD